MGPSRSEEVRNVAVVGHRGAGKTALVEAMLYVAGVTRQLGRPGAWSPPLDDTPEEKAHQATFETRCGTLEWRGARVHVFDTPGEASFLAQTRLALDAADAAILVVSAKDGVQSGTERVFKWVREQRIPCLVVITEPDDAHARFDDVVTDIRKQLDAHADLMEVPDGTGDGYHGVVEVERPAAWLTPETAQKHESVQVPESLRGAVAKARARLVDDAAAADDALTEKYLEKGDLSQEELDAAVKAAIARSQLLPLFIASPVKPTGVAALLDAVVHLLPGPAQRDEEPASLLVFKTTNDVHAGRATWARVLGGKLTAEVSLALAGKGDVRERLGSILEPVGGDLRTVAEARSGDVVMLPKLKHAHTGDVLYDEKAPQAPEKPPMPPAIFSRALMVDSKGHEEKVAQALQRLAEEDPGLTFTFDDATRDLVLSGLGTMHLDVTAGRLRRRAGVEFKLGPPRIPFRETVLKPVKNVEGKQKKQSGGHGQFGVCYVDLEPLPRGSGFVFEDAIVGGVIPRQFILSVHKGIERALHRGVLAGYPVTDVKVRLVDGKTHSVDSSDAAFQVAGYRAFLAAASQAGACLLEPVMKIRVKAPADAVGDVIGDLNGRHGRVLSTDAADAAMVVEAMVPLTQLLDYEPRLTALTRGRGSFAMQFDHYDPAPGQLQEKIVKDSGFKPPEE